MIKHVCIQFGSQFTDLRGITGDFLYSLEHNQLDQVAAELVWIQITVISRFFTMKEWIAVELFIKTMHRVQQRRSINDWMN